MSDIRVVFDCNIFLQGLGAPNGPSGRCVQLALDGKVQLFVSPVVLAEIREVATRPKVVRKLHLTEGRLEALLRTVETAATLVTEVPEHFTYQRDPDDAHYINLAIAADAKLVVSRDQDLLDLMNASSPEAASFRTRFPDVHVVTPVDFISQFEAS